MYERVLRYVFINDYLLKHAWLSECSASIYVRQRAMLTKVQGL